MRLLYNEFNTETLSISWFFFFYNLYKDHWRGKVPLGNQSWVRVQGNQCVSKSKPVHAYCIFIYRAGPVLLLNIKDAEYFDSLLIHSSCLLMGLGWWLMPKVRHSSTARKFLKVFHTGRWAKSSDRHGIELRLSVVLMKFVRLWGTMLKAKPRLSLTHSF